MYPCGFFSFCFCVAPSGPPQSLTSEPQNSRTLELSWEPPADDMQNGLLRHYHIAIRSSQDVVGERNFTTSEVTLVVQNLHPFYTYEFVVTAVTIGPGPSASITSRLPQDSKKLLSHSRVLSLP